MVANSRAKEPLLEDCHRHGSEGCHKHAHGSGCEGGSHVPGMCHGFDTTKKGMWTVVHDDVALENYLDPNNNQGNVRAMRALGCATAAVFVVMTLESVCGYLTGSLALVSDAAHQLSDVVLYAGLLISVFLSTREGKVDAYSFGYHRAQVLGAFVALLLQYFITGLVVARAVSRLCGQQQAVDGRAICLMASISLFTNMLLFWLMPASGHGHSHGGGGGKSSATSVAQMHVLGDLLQGGVCVLVGVVTWVQPQSAWLDSASAFFYAVMVICSTFALFKDFIHVLMERTPQEIKADQMFDELSRIKDVIDVHCCHVWMIAPEKIAMSAHLHIEDGCHEEVLHRAQIVLKHKYGIVHSTLQISEDEDLA
eukprot:TRINITY_DN61665_c0_g1_i1.p1 TRINITY_DN61665_c0_g1~~TRINITY_DN61665_c0_g1_i1.p1  ORF type:complete len:367 (+),score=49.01 TRINITY_DN61665_c0_g1_i1:53-1153(+)